jgi:radical SAM protein with 4Fe4S-binding SPASM domain
MPVKNSDLTDKPIRIDGRRPEGPEKLLVRVLGEGYLAYRRKFVEASRRALLTEFPLHLQVEHVGACNLRCPSCIQGISALRRAYIPNPRPLGIVMYKKVINEAHGFRCPSISFHNNDEPLLLRDLESRIRLAREAGFLDIILTTNATLLTPGRAEGLLDSGVTKISFSIDACDEEGYARKRPGGDFKAVMKNIEYFLALKKKRGLQLPVTRITYLLTKSSVRERRKFYRFWKDRVDVVEFQHFQVIKGVNEKLRFSGSKVIDNFSCNMPWQQLVVRANGDILPCCSFYGHEMAVGNINNSSLYDIWHGHRMSEIRDNLMRGNFKFSSACRKCSETLYV